MAVFYAGGGATSTTPPISNLNSGFHGFLHNGWLRPEVAQYLNSARAGFLTPPASLAQPAHFLGKMGRRSPPTLFPHSGSLMSPLTEEKLFKSNGSIGGDQDNGSNSD